MREPRRRKDDYTEATRRALIQSAETLFGRHGYGHTSMDDVAEGARVTKGAIYHHFAGKKALFEAVQREICARLIVAVVTDLAAQDEVTVTDIFEAYLDAACVHPFPRLALMEGRAALGWERWRHNLDVTVMQPFADLLERFLGRNFSEPTSWELFVPTVVSVLNELTLEVTGNARPHDARRETRRLIIKLAGTLPAGLLPDRPGVPQGPDVGPRG